MPERPARPRRYAKPGRDFEAEQRWLLRLPTSPHTDLLQDEWEKDPEVIEWRRKQSNRVKN